MAVSSRFRPVYFRYVYYYSKYVAYTVVYMIIFIQSGLSGSAAISFNNS